MTLKIDAKFKEKLVNFLKYIRFELKNKEELYFMTLDSDAKIDPCDLGVLKMAFKELGRLSLEHSKV